MNICRHCKINEGVIVDSQSTYKNKIYCYYTCSRCNSLRAKKYRATDSGKKSISEIQNRQVIKFRYKVNARSRLNYAIKKKHIIKPTHCSICLEYKKLDAHHENYDKPLEVLWLCRQCHSKVLQ